MQTPPCGMHACLTKWHLAAYRQPKLASDKMRVCHRSNGQHLVWRAGSTMSPADFCHMSGNTKDRPRDCIIISHSRQTLAQFEAAVRADLHWRKPRQIAADLFARATAGGSSGNRAPQAPSFVTVFLQPALSPLAHSSAPALAAHASESPQQPPQEPPDPQHIDAACTWQRALLAGAGGAGGEGGGVAKGILVSRSNDGWYKVLLIEVIPDFHILIQSDSAKCIHQDCVCLVSQFFFSLPLYVCFRLTSCTRYSSIP